MNGRWHTQRCQRLSSSGCATGIARSIRSHELAYQYPEEQTMPGLTAQQALEAQTWQGASERYPEGVPDKVIALLKHELRLIETLQYASYFLT
jgi:DNA polymerase III alpha subunit